MAENHEFWGYINIGAAQMGGKKTHREILSEGEIQKTFALEAVTEKGLRGVFFHGNHEETDDNIVEGAAYICEPDTEIPLNCLPSNWFTHSLATLVKENTIPEKKKAIKKFAKFLRKKSKLPTVVDAYNACFEKDAICDFEWRYTTGGESSRVELRYNRAKNEFWIITYICHRDLSMAMVKRLLAKHGSPDTKVSISELTSCQEYLKAEELALRNAQGVHQAAIEAFKFTGTAHKNDYNVMLSSDAHEYPRLAIPTIRTSTGMFVDDEMRGSPVKLLLNKTASITKSCQGGLILMTTPKDPIFIFPIPEYPKDLIRDSPEWTKWRVWSGTVPTCTGRRSKKSDANVALDDGGNEYRQMISSLTSTFVDENGNPIGYRQYHPLYDNTYRSFDRHFANIFERTILDPDNAIALDPYVVRIG